MRFRRKKRDTIPSECAAKNKSVTARVITVITALPIFFFLFLQKRKKMTKKEKKKEAGKSDEKGKLLPLLQEKKKTEAGAHEMERWGDERPDGATEIMENKKVVKTMKTMTRWC